MRRTVVKVNNSDDEEWLYRRGPYANDTVRPAARTPEAGQSFPLRAGESLPEPARPRAAEPTPVGHYGAPGGSVGDYPGRGADPRMSRSASRSPGSAVPPRAPRFAKPSGRRIVVIAVLVVGLLLAYLLGVPFMTWSSTPKTKAIPAGQRPADTPGSIYVLAGSDSREGLSPEEQKRLGTGNDAGKRTDTIMLLYVPPSGRAAIVSVPRDSYVDIPGRGKHKINAAYAFGGAPLLVQTIEQNTGLHVDGFVEVGFGGFVKVVDAVGGIEMCPKKAIKDRDSNLDIPGGCQLMDGKTALGYVRMRKADPLGDLGRVKRQREMVSALAKKVITPATVALPWRYWGVNSAASQAVKIGEDTDKMGLAGAAMKVGSGEADTLVIPIGNPNAKTKAGSSVLWDPAKSKAFFEAMKRGDGNLKKYA